MYLNVTASVLIGANWGDLRGVSCVKLYALCNLFGPEISVTSETCIWGPGRLLLFVLGPGA